MKTREEVHTSEMIDKFIYLSSLISANNGTGREVKRCITLANKKFYGVSNMM